MRKEIIERYIYKFEELNKDAQNKAFEEYKNADNTIEVNNDIFYKDTIYELNEIFPNSEFDIQYSVSCCQGDGFNIYGEFSIVDLLFIYESLKNSTKYCFDKPVFDFIKNNINIFYDVTLKANRRYTYSLWDHSEYRLAIKESMVVDYEQKFDVDLYNNGGKEETYLHLFTSTICTYISDLCSKYYNQAYDFIHSENLTIEDFKEICDFDNYEFLEDGTMY